MFGLIQHLYIGIFLTDLMFYSRVIWPLNMFILGISSTGLFIGKGKVKNYIEFTLLVVIFILPLILPFFSYSNSFLQLLSWVYIVYFLSVFIEVIKFLIKPHYINLDIILASTCGYLLLIEINTFLMFSFYHSGTLHFSNINNSSPPASIFMDLVYFSTIVKTSIGFGDITPISHQTKLLTAFFGIISQFYAVILIGILIGKFTSKEDSK